MDRGWYIQILALRTFGKDEEKILRRLKESGFRVTVQKTSIGSIPYFRLLVGAFQSKAEAEDERTRLAKFSTSFGNAYLNRVYAITKI